MYVNKCPVGGKAGAGFGRARGIKADEFKQGTREDRDVPP
jgi:hypothetical protein